MAEPTNHLTALAALAGLADKVAVELVYAAPGKDDGLLPINCLLTDVEAIVAAGPLLAPFPQSLSRARAAVDAGLEQGCWNAGHLAELAAWVKWMQFAVSLAIDNQPLPDFPAPSTALAAAPSPPLPCLSPSTPGGLPPDDALQMNVASDGDLLREFISESREHLQIIELGVLTLEENPTDKDTLNSIFRAFHTFKGGSGFLNLLPMKNLAHELESLLDLARKQRLTVNSDIINVILEGGDTLKQFITEMGAQLAGEKPAGPIVVPAQALLARVRACLENPGATLAAKPAAPPANVIPLSNPASADLAPSPLATPSLPVSKPGGPSSGAVASPGSVKVDILKLDSLVDLVGEMVIAQSLIAQDKDLASLPSQQLARNLAKLRRITNDLQRAAMSMRLVPIRATFQKMTRLVRDTAARTGKQAELTMEGEDTELDRTIVEEISDPLIHMVRNSVDHGIERPEVRVKNGKPPTGTVRLRAFHQGGTIVIEIRDDGAGLNKDRILATAIEKGLVRAGECVADKEIFNLIFAPGFSTATVITDISGRGVGMDVVRKNIDRLRGKIEIRSTPGEGSVITIYLPLTLAIIDGLIVSVGTERYVIPTLSVRESFRPTPGMISTLHGRGEMVNVRGRLSPLLRLHEHFGVRPESREPTEGILVVVEADGADRCVLVDRLLGKQEVVIKSLGGEMFNQNPSLAGGTILGDGRVGLILDVNFLVRLRTFPPLSQAA